MSSFAAIDERRLRVLTTRHYVMPANLPRLSRHELIEAKFYDPWRRLWDWSEGIGVWDPRLKYDLVHSYNKIPFTSKPWLVTFEDQLPRLFGKNPFGFRELLLQRLLLPSCRAVVPMSDYALNMFRLEHRGWAGLPQALAKAQVIYPNVPVLATEAKEFDGGTLHLAFVGNDFARKGGLVAVRAAKQAHAKGWPVHFHIASSLRIGAQGYFDSLEPGVYDADMRLLDLPNVTLHGNLKHTEVLDLLGKSHFHILPSLDDSFGLSVIESLSAAAPAIVSSVCALPEMIQDGHNGYVLNLPIDEFRKWEGTRLRSWPKIDEACGSLTDQLLTRIEGVLDSPSDYASLSAHALEAARTKFSSVLQKDRLDSLYTRCAAEASSR